MHGTGSDGHRTSGATDGPRDRRYGEEPWSRTRTRRTPAGSASTGGGGRTGAGTGPVLWWYLTFEDAPAVRGLARRAQDLIGRAPQLDLIPSPWLHLTLLEVGFADEVPTATVDRVVDTTRRALEDFPGFDLGLGPVRSLPGAVVLEAHADALGPLHERLTDAVLAARGADAVGALRAFVPHVSVAYVNRDCDPHEVMGPLDGADLSSPSPSATVTRVRLAAVTRERRHYQWTTRAVVPTGKVRRFPARRGHRPGGALMQAEVRDWLGRRTSSGEDWDRHELVRAKGTPRSASCSLPGTRRAPWATSSRS